MNDSIIADYLDGIMPSADDEAAMLERLAADPDVAADCAAQGRIHALLPMALDDSTAAAAMAKRVVAHLRKPAGKPMRRQPWVVALVAAAAVLVVGFLLLTTFSKPVERPWSLAIDRLDVELPLSAAHLRLAAGTRYRLGEESGPNVEIATGGIEVAIDRHLSTPFTIVTPQATATVLGTAFRVRADAEGTSLEVQRGRVRLAGNSLAGNSLAGNSLARNSGQPVEVGAGQGSQCRLNGAATAPQLLLPSAPILDQILPDGDLPHWRTTVMGASRITLSDTVAGGGIAATIQHSGVAADWTWFGCSTACAQDWRGAQGLSFEVQAIGAGLVVEVGGYLPDGGAYYFSSAPVSGLGSAWRTVHLPFSAFARYPGHAAEVSGPVAPIIGQIAHVGFFPGACSQVAVRGLRLWHDSP